ncbi:MAG: glycosyltransferase family 9 protein, partial [Bacteroidota bacterium]|nr:glycosyltransferase family 9 protein [Bacteroidota bacterium]
FSRLVSLPLPMNQMPMTEQLQYLLSGVIALPEAKPERPSIVIDNSIELSVRQEVGSLLEKPGFSKFVLLNIDAPAFKKWNLADNIKLAQSISNSYPEYAIILTSLPENKVKMEGLLKEADIQRAFYFATPDIQFMTALIRCSSLVITPDTSIVHLASAENKPIVSFHLTAGEWLPYKVDAFVILPVKGEPISSIPFETVWTAVKTMLDERHDRNDRTTRLVYGENPSEVVIRTD